MYSNSNNNNNNNNNMNGYNFGYILEALREGHKVARAGWNGKGMWLKLQVPDAHSKMTLPYIYMSTAHVELVPWIASQTDILACDWELLELAEDGSDIHKEDTVAS